MGYTVGNFVLLRRVSGAVKHDFRPYIPILMHFLTFKHRKHFILCKTLASLAT